MEVRTTIERVSPTRFEVTTESRSLLQTEIGRFAVVLDGSRDADRRVMALQRRWLGFLEAELRVDARTRRFPCARDKMMRYQGSVRSAGADGGTRKVVFYGVECGDGRRLECRYPVGAVDEAVWVESGFFVSLMEAMAR